MADAIVILKGESMRGRSGESEREFPLYPIEPILQSYGGAAVAEGLGWKPYRCPWHGDRDASASVNTEKQVFNCHAADCPKGNAVQVVMQAEGMTFVEAQQRTADLLGEGVRGVRSASGRRGRMVGGTRSRAGVRSFKRTWRSP